MSSSEEGLHVQTVDKQIEEANLLIKRVMCALHEIKSGITQCKSPHDLDANDTCQSPCFKQEPKQASCGHTAIKSNADCAETFSPCRQPLAAKTQRITCKIKVRQPLRTTPDAPVNICTRSGAQQKSSDRARMDCTNSRMNKSPRTKSPCDHSTCPVHNIFPKSPFTCDKIRAEKPLVEECSNSVKPSTPRRDQERPKTRRGGTRSPCGVTDLDEACRDGIDKFQMEPCSSKSSCVDRTQHEIEQNLTQVMNETSQSLELLKAKLSVISEPSETGSETSNKKPDDKSTDQTCDKDVQTDISSAETERSSSHSVQDSTNESLQKEKVSQDSQATVEETSGQTSESSVDSKQEEEDESGEDVENEEPPELDRAQPNQPPPEETVSQYSKRSESPREKLAFKEEVETHHSRFEETSLVSYEHLNKDLIPDKLDSSQGGVDSVKDEIETPSERSFKEPPKPCAASKENKTGEVSKVQISVAETSSDRSQGSVKKCTRCKNEISPVKTCMCNQIRPQLAMVHQPVISNIPETSQTTREGERRCGCKAAPKLAVQHIPPINIRSPLIVQKVLEMTIKPTGSTDAVVEYNANVKYEEIEAVDERLSAEARKSSFIHPMDPKRNESVSSAELRSVYQSFQILDDSLVTTDMFKMEDAQDSIYSGAISIDVYKTYIDPNVELEFSDNEEQHEVMDISKLRRQSAIKQNMNLKRRDSTLPPNRSESPFSPQGTLPFNSTAEQEQNKQSLSRVDFSTSIQSSRFGNRDPYEIGFYENKSVQCISSELMKTTDRPPMKIISDTKPEPAKPVTPPTRDNAGRTEMDTGIQVDSFSESSSASSSNSSTSIESSSDNEQLKSTNPEVDDKLQQCSFSSSSSASSEGEDNIPQKLSEIPESVATQDSRSTGQSLTKPERVISSISFTSGESPDSRESGSRINASSKYKNKTNSSDLTDNVESRGSKEMAQRRKMSPEIEVTPDRTISDFLTGLTDKSPRNLSTLVDKGQGNLSGIFELGREHSSFVEENIDEISLDENAQMVANLVHSPATPKAEKSSKSISRIHMVHTDQNPPSFIAKGKRANNKKHTDIKENEIKYHSEELSSPDTASSPRRMPRVGLQNHKKDHKLDHSLSYSLGQDSSLSDGDYKCRCSISSGEIHICPFRKENRNRVKYLKKHPEKMLRKELGHPNLELLGQRTFYNNWVAYYVQLDSPDANENSLSYSSGQKI